MLYVLKVLDNDDDTCYKVLTFDSEEAMDKASKIITEFDKDWYSSDKEITQRFTGEYVTDLNNELDAYGINQCEVELYKMYVR